METEIEDKEITDYVNEWLQNNTVKGRFNMSEATENIIRCEQVRIPLFDSNNNAIDARQFAKGLQKFFKAAPFYFEVKLMTRGLGEGILILGEK
jgi:Mg2+/Co2+ transporter CorC